MTESELEKCRKRLEQFLADLLEPLGRRERRHWSSVYIRGLLLDGERKSIEPLAARLPDGNVQAMQQLIGRIFLFVLGGGFLLTAWDEGS